MSDDRTVPTAAPADRPSFKILVGGTAVSAEYQVQSVVVSRGFNRVAAAEIFVLDGDPSAESFKVSNAADFLPGAEVEVQAGYHGTEESIFRGIVVRHGVKSLQRKPSQLRVECRDASVKLTVGRKSAYFYDQKDSEIIESLAGDAGLQTEVEATQVSHPQMVQFYSTDWDFILTRAEANGKVVLTSDGKLVVKAPDASAAPAVSLRFGGNLLEFEAVMDARTQFSSVQTLAWSAADQAMVEVEAAAGSAAAPGNVSSDDLASVIGLSALALKHAGQVKDQELQAWADGEKTRSGFAKVRGRARTQGFAAIHPGDVIDLAGIGDRFTGKALVAGVRHEIDGRNWETDIEFGLSAEAFGSRERNVIEAPANGLLPGVGGLQIGLVTALEGDPGGEERIKVRIPLIDPGEEGVWARIATLDAGSSRGTVFRPEIGDEVVLGFLNDDPRNPVVLGQMHSSAKASPIPAADANNEKGLVTRSGIEFKFDDDKKVVTLKTPGGNSVVVSDDAQGILFEDQNGNKLSLDSNGIKLESASDVSIKASGDIKIQGANVENKADAQFKAEGSGGAEVSSSANTTIKGSLVQIN
ncbi:MAG: type IV secretion protein Rhs [Betaproteobacteria bacterium RIFCSPLOWO2_02_FULL_62_17]|nr:MAG: type IV secretion protein Rhs [Betaproteobacteria bacterium RIFCSPLOWO2_02_FULL_62_17]